jgi:hypothetical protein
MDAKYPLPSPDQRIAPCEVEATLKRLLREERLRLSERNRRFLTFVVSETLAGRGGRIKAYTIGVDVFGRGEDFDPANDPIVRIEATRIRSALSAYYEKFGGDERIRIVIPPGTYAPVFEFAKLERIGVAQPGPSQSDNCFASDAKRHRPAIVVTVRSTSQDRAGSMLVEWLKQTVAARLRAMKLRVFLAPSPERRAATQAIERLLLNPDSAYALDIAIHADGAHHRQSWAFVDLSTGELLDSVLEDRTGAAPPDLSTVDAIVERACKMIEEALSLDEPARSECGRRTVTSAQSLGRQQQPRI